MNIADVSTLDWITYGCLLIATLVLWVQPRFFIPAILITVGAAWIANVTGPLGVVAIGALIALCYAEAQQRGVWKTVLFWSSLVLGLVIGLHAVPGFRATFLATNVVVSPNSEPYTLALGFDKTIAGVILLRFYGPALLRSWSDVLGALKKTLPILVITVVVLMGASLLLGYVDVEPKWSALFPLWAMKNLFHTCLAEEAFFRGALLHRMIEMTPRWKHAVPGWLIISSVLFGVAHGGGGWQYVLVSCIAGVGYGLAFVATRRIEMSILTHFAVNSIHFIFFTYPRTAGL